MISHAEAQALTSARLDGPLDPVAERELLAHLASCAVCRRFAEEAQGMASSLRAMPMLPASPTVTRAVLAHVNKPRSPWSTFGGLFSFQAMPALSAVATILVVIALGAFVFFRLDPTGTPLDRDDGQELQATVPDESLIAPNPTEAPTNEFALEAEPTNTPPDGADRGTSPTENAAEDDGAPAEEDQPATDAPTSTAEDAVSGQTEPTEETVATEQPVDEPTDEPVATEEPTVEPAATEAPSGEPTEELPPTSEPESSDSQPAEAATVAPTSEADAQAEPTETTTAQQFIAGDEDTATPSATTEPSQTPEPTIEPTATPTETAEPSATPTETPEPTETETATPEPTATDEPTLAPTETPEPTETSEPTATDEPSATASETPEPTATPTETPQPTATEEPTQTPEPTEEPTKEPTETLEPTAAEEPTATPTETPEPTATETPEPTATEEPTAEPTDESPAIVPSDGSEPIDADETPEETPAEEIGIAPSPTPEETPAEEIGIAPTPTPGDDEIDEQATDEATTEPTATEEPAGFIAPDDSTDDTEESTQTPEGVGSAGDDDATAEPTVGSDNQIDPADTTDEEASPTEEDPQGGDSLDGSSGVLEDSSQPYDDVSGSGDGGGRLGSSGGQVFVAADPDAASLVNDQGQRIETVDTGNGSRLVVCDESGCTEPVSAAGSDTGDDGQSITEIDSEDASDDADADTVTGAAADDTPIGWVGDTVYYVQRSESGTTYRAATYDGGSLVNDQALLDVTEDQVATVGYEAGNGLLLPTDAVWISLSTDGSSQEVGANPFGSVSSVRTNFSNGEIVYIGDGQVVVASVDAPGSPRATLGVPAVDVDLSPGGERIVIATGTSVQILTLDGDLVASYDALSGATVSSVLWIDEGILWLDASSGQVSLIPSANLPQA